MPREHVTRPVPNLSNPDLDKRGDRPLCAELDSRPMEFIFESGAEVLFMSIQDQVIYT